MKAKYFSFSKFHLMYSFMPNLCKASLGQDNLIVVKMVRKEARQGIFSSNNYVTFYIIYILYIWQHII